MGIWEIVKGYLRHEQRHEHRHDFKRVGDVWRIGDNPMSAGAFVAEIYRCECGAEERELTVPGLQQVFEWGASREDVLYGRYRGDSGN